MRPTPHHAARPKPRVLIDATALRALSGFRGIGRYTQELLLGLAALGDDLPFTALAATSLAPLRFSTDLAALVEESEAERGALSNRVFMQRRFALGAALATTGARALHMPQAYGMPLARVGCLIVTCHDLIPLEMPEHYLGLALGSRRYGARTVGFSVRLARDLVRYRRADHVICISERTRQSLTRFCQVDDARLSVVYNSASRFERAPLAAVDSGAAPYVLYVGYCDPRKDIRSLFAALALVNRRHALRLAWAAALLPHDRAKMVALARAMGVEDRVDFLGFVSDERLRGLYAGAVALVFPSRLEGFGLPVLEAMAAGCAVIVTRDSGADEVAGASGFVVDPERPDQLAEAIAVLHHDAARRDLAQREGRTRARTFTRDAMARGTAAAYLRALALHEGLAPAAQP
ncbi:MAG: glycosyltransferase family 4 protein [Myxococcales bacterium]|nr:glycosyltransferase family 4 protein [Myxococcales bacterium]